MDSGNFISKPMIELQGIGNTAFVCICAAIVLYFFQDKMDEN